MIDGDVQQGGRWRRRRVGALRAEPRGGRYLRVTFGTPQRQWRRTMHQKRAPAGLSLLQVVQITGVCPAWVRAVTAATPPSSAVR
jgi:hypothetical protein